MIEILKFEMINKGSLIAKFNIKMQKWGGLIIKDCVLFNANGKKWITLPSKQYESDGKKKYFSYLSYENIEMDRKFKEIILKSVEDYIEKNKTSGPTNDLNSQIEFPF